MTQPFNPCSPILSAGLGQLRARKKAAVLPPVGRSRRSGWGTFTQFQLGRGPLGGALYPAGAGD